MKAAAPLPDALPQAQRGNTTVRTAVVGVGGYAGGELARLLLHHPRLFGTAPLFLGRTDKAHSAETVESLHPQLAGTESHPVLPFEWNALTNAGTEILLLADAARAIARLGP